ncbi:MAG: triose-phosphate isomerase [Pirellulales bacterium]|nr:triose-phosphate isomerase [Pirellulales bacterium]
MRKLLIAGNWKMNMDRGSAVQLAQGIAARAAEFPGIDLLVCPPSIYIAPVADAVAGSAVAVGGQNMYHQTNGAYTGEISGAMLQDVGATYVILGHSERRTLMGETDEDVNAKLLAALNAGLTPIVCVGEILDQREAGQTPQVIRSQFTRSLAGLTAEQMTQTVLAYEPVWAIGTGKVATPDQAEEVHADLRKLLAEYYNNAIAQQVRILYGGSMKASNAAQLIAQPNVDGGLIGGASLKVEEFLGIARAGM